MATRKYIPKKAARNIIRATLLGNELTSAVDTFVVLFNLTEMQHRALSDVLAALIGRATSMAANAVVQLTEPLMERLDRLELAEAPHDETRGQTNGR